MRSVLLKAILGLSVAAAGIISMENPASAQYVQIQSRQFPGHCLGLSNGSTANGTLIGLFPCNAWQHAQDQAWHIDNADVIFGGTGLEFDSIRNGLNFSKCIGASGGHTTQYTMLILWDCLGHTHGDQYWNNQVLNGYNVFWDYGTQFDMGLDYDYSPPATFLSISNPIGWYQQWYMTLAYQ